MRACPYRTAPQTALKGCLPCHHAKTWLTDVSTVIPELSSNWASCAGFSGATATAIATAAKTYITAVTTLLRPLGASNTNLSASIMPADASKTPKVAFYVRVGQLKDTQRRRRNALRENPSVVAL